MKPLPVALLATLLLAACPPKANTPTGPGGTAAALGAGTVVATYEGKQVTLGELDKSIARDLYQMRLQNLETMIIRKLVQAEAAKENKTEDQFLGDLQAKVGGAVDEATVQMVYEQNKEAFGGRSLDEVRPMIEGRMKQEKAKEGMMRYFTELKTKANVKILLQEPRLEVPAIGPAKGPEGAPVTIVEFSDFQCPFCSKASQVAQQVVTAYAGKVRLVFRDFPLPFHDKAQKAHEAGRCAGDQGKFWELHDWMFANQSKLDVASIKEAAKGLGIDAAKFDACVDGGTHAAKVKADLEAGSDLGVNGTPSFFVNGKPMSGGLDFEKLKAAVDAELAAK